MQLLFDPKWLRVDRVGGVHAQEIHTLDDFHIGFPPSLSCRGFVNAGWERSVLPMHPSTGGGGGGMAATFTCLNIWIAFGSETNQSDHHVLLTTEEIRDQKRAPQQCICYGHQELRSFLDSATLCLITGKFVTQEQAERTGKLGLE